MLRGHPNGWGPFRQALFALVPVLLGTAVVVAGGDEPVADGNRIEATQTTVTAALERPAVSASPDEAPALQTPGPAAASPAPAADALEATAEMVLFGPTSTVPGPTTAVAVAGDSSDPVAGTTDVTPASSTTTPPTLDSTVPTTVPAPATTTTTTTTTTPAPEPTGRAPNPSAAAEVVPLTNADRAGAGLGTLSRSSCLDSVASGFAEQMARSEVLAHNPDAGAGILGCRPGATWGDNVGKTLPCDTALLERQWMASPSHRRNILTGAFTLIGVGAWTGEDGTCWIQVLFSS